MTNLVNKTFKEDGLLAKELDHYSVREQQIEMAEKIQECIKEEKHLLAEAPTGVGKSLAALVPAFEHIKKTDEPVIVVTSSIVLQEQYINKDIPLLEKLYDFSVNPVLLKGRNNYLCAKKFREVKSGNMNASTDQQVKEHQTLQEWAVTTKTGDKSELDFVPSFQVWSQYACVENTECTGKQCPLYNICHYYRERNKVTTSKLIICNYHYFFTALDNENMLPENARVVILDEGHEVSSIARDFQERKYSMNSLQNQFDRFRQSMEKAKFTDVGESLIPLFEDMNLNNVNGTLTELFVGLGHEYKKKKGSSRDFWTIEVPERSRFQKYATAHIEALRMASGEAERYLAKHGFSPDDIFATTDMYGEEVADWFMDVQRLSEFLSDKADLLEYIFAYDEEQDEGTDIFWLQKYQDSVSIHVKPTTGASLTADLFKKKQDGFITIIMSATLSAAQSFAYLKEELGIEKDIDKFPVEEIIVSSPFNLDENLLWYLPNNTPPGNDPNHLDFVLSEMNKVILKLNGRTLCLFTSKKNLQTAEAYFRGILPKEINLISQEQLPRQKIIEYMKENDQTVVLGTKSFFTGIDIQGPHLSAVLIDKIPFPMLGDPINDYLMSQPNGFYKFSLPEAIISTKQAFGRLNRTMHDKGLVAIYDGRLSTARYKNRIFNSFDFKVNATKDWNEAENFLSNLQQEANLSLF